MRVLVGLTLLFLATSAANAQIRPIYVAPSRGLGGANRPMQSYAPLNRQSIGPSNAFMGYAPYLTPTTPTPLFTPGTAGRAGSSTGAGGTFSAPRPVAPTGSLQPLTPFPTTGRLR